MKLLVLFALGALASAHAQNPAPFTINIVSTEIEGERFSYPYEGPDDGFVAKVTFTLEAVRSNAWIYLRASEKTQGFRTGATWQAKNIITGQIEPGEASVSVLEALTGGTEDNNVLRIDEGATATLRLVTYYSPAAPVSGYFRFLPQEIWIGQTLAEMFSTPTAYAFPEESATTAVYIQSVPEPSAIMSIIGGIGMLAMMRRRR